MDEVRTAVGALRRRAYAGRAGNKGKRHRTGTPHLILLSDDMDSVHRPGTDDGAVADTNGRGTR